MDPNVFRSIIGMLSLDDLFSIRMVNRWCFREATIAMKRRIRAIFEPLKKEFTDWYQELGYCPGMQEDTTTGILWERLRYSPYILDVARRNRVLDVLISKAVFNANNVYKENRDLGFKRNLKLLHGNEAYAILCLIKSDCAGDHRFKDNTLRGYMRGRVGGIVTSVTVDWIKYL